MSMGTWWQERPAKRFRSEESCTRSMAMAKCGYRDCPKPRFEKSPGVFYRTCGLTHHNMAMADAAGSSISSSESGQEGTCKLPGCSRRVQNDAATERRKEFCNYAHLLKFNEIAWKRLDERGKLCNIKSCLRHVYVDNCGKCHDYCGGKHAIKAARARGAGVGPEFFRRVLPGENGEEDMNSNSDEGADYPGSSSNTAPSLGGSMSQSISERPGDVRPRNQDHGKVDIPREDCQGNSGYGEISSLEIADFLDAAYEAAMADPLKSNPIVPRQGDINIFQGVDISKSHPWEVNNGGKKPRHFLLWVKPSDMDNKQGKRTRTTRASFGWKQSSRKYSPKNASVISSYFKYQTMTSSGKSHTPTDEEQEHLKRRHGLHEIQLHPRENKRCSLEKVPVIWKIAPPHPLRQRSSSGSQASTAEDLVVGNASDLFYFQDDIVTTNQEWDIQEDLGHFDDIFSYLTPGLYE